MWLIGGLAPDHKTIAEFRKNNKKAIEEAHKEFIRICNELKLLGKEVVALDGTKIKANNSRKNNVTISKLNKMIEELKITGNVKVLADKGYWRMEDLVKCHQDAHIEAIVAVPKEKGTPGFRKSDFLYNAEKDEYICPMGKILTRWKGKSATYTNRKACKECPKRDKCTKNKQGRQIVRNESEHIIEEAVERYKTKVELYKLRQQLVEHPFGTIKRSLGFTYFLLRRLENVKTENFLHVITYNLKRVLNIFSVPDLVERLRRIEEQQDQEMASVHCKNSAFLSLFDNIIHIYKKYRRIRIAF